MSLALGIVCLNEAAWLRLHLPVMLQAESISGVVAIDGGSVDGSVDAIFAAAEKAGVQANVSVRFWDWNFAHQQNAVIELAERLGYTALLKYDPDELMFPAAIDAASALIDSGTKAVVFPRINFEGDRLHYAPYTNPRDLLDYQTRLHVLHQGFRWRGQLHAGVNAWDLWNEDRSNAPDAPRDIVRLHHAWIYHYEGIKPIEQRALKWLNYEQARQGKPPLPALPADYRVPSLPVRWAIPFTGVQPLDPHKCGVMAPYSEVRV